MAKLLEEMCSYGPMVIPLLNRFENDDEIVWPPMVVVMNTRYEREENGKWNGMGSEELLDHFHTYSALEARHSYGPVGHRGMSLLIFDSSASGYLEAIRLHMHFVEQGRGRNSWDRDRITFSLGGKCQLYGYMALEDDLYIFNEYSEDLKFEMTSCKFEMTSCKEMVYSHVEKLGEECLALKLLSEYKDLHQKEQKESLAPSEPPSRDNEQLSIAVASSILRPFFVMKLLRQKVEAASEKIWQVSKDPLCDAPDSSVASSEPGLELEAADPWVTSSQPICELETYMAEQDEHTVRIALYLPGVHKGKIKQEFHPYSFDVKLQCPDKKLIYRCHHSLLNAPIIPTKCYVVPQPDGVYIILFKASNNDWLDLPIKRKRDGQPMPLLPASIPHFLSHVEKYYDFPYRVCRPGLVNHKHITLNAAEKVLECYNMKNHADYQLVELVTSAKMGFGEGAPWVIHVNFKAKRENSYEDQEAVLFFGETKDWNMVTACTIINDTYEIQNSCQICDPDDLIQHPVGGLDADCKKHAKFYLPSFDIIT